MGLIPLRRTRDKPSQECDQASHLRVDAASRWSGSRGLRSRPGSIGAGGPAARHNEKLRLWGGASPPQRRPPSQAKPSENESPAIAPVRGPAAGSPYIWERNAPGVPIPPDLLKHVGGDLVPTALCSRARCCRTSYFFPSLGASLSGEALPSSKIIPSAPNSRQWHDRANAMSVLKSLS